MNQHSTVEARTARYLSLVDRSAGTDACWPWRGYVSRSGGYGQVTFLGRRTSAHRLIYELLVGSIPPGLQIDHLCRNRACVNPDHMEPVPVRVNVLRGIGPTARNARKTHCINGHPLSGSNLYTARNGDRACNVCMRASTRRWRERSARKVAVR